MTTPDLLTCEQTFARLDDYLDRELSAEEQEAVQRHLETCDVCTAEYRFEGSLLDELERKVRSLRPPSGLKARIAARLAAARDGNGSDEGP